LSQLLFLIKLIIEKYCQFFIFISGLLLPERMELDEFIEILKIKYNCAKVTILYINLDEDG